MTERSERKVTFMSEPLFFINICYDFWHCVNNHNIIRFLVLFCQVLLYAIVSIKAKKPKYNEPFLYC